MKRFLCVLALIGVAIVCLGFYQGWFHIGSDKADGKSNVTFSMDTDKFQKDRKTAVADVKDMGHHIKDKVAGPGEKTMDGTVVSVNADQLTMTNMEGQEHSHTLPSDIKVTCDGKACKAADLKSGMRIRVTTNSSEPHAMTRIEALDNNKDFEKVQGS